VLSSSDTRLSDTINQRGVPKPISKLCSCYDAISRCGVTACSCFISGTWALLCETSCPSAAGGFLRSLLKIGVS